MLPEPQIPFPVSSDHRIRPDLLRLEGPVFQLDREYPHYRQSKLKSLAQPWCPVVADWADPAAIQAALQSLLRTLLSEHPLHTQPLTEHASWQDLGQALALAVQDDLVLMRGHELEAAWVCFPSNWNPREKVGKSFAEIHAPVPHSEKLQVAQHNVSKAMSFKGPYVRYVWGLSFDPSLSHHPERPPYAQQNQVYFRTERQVTLPLPGLERSWFLIRVYMAPVEQVVNSPERKQQLRNAILSMPEAHRAYKSGTVKAYERLAARGFF
jgi:hypothetical protein